MREECFGWDCLELDRIYVELIVCNLDHKVR